MNDKNLIGYVLGFVQGMNLRIKEFSRREGLYLDKSQGKQVDNIIKDFDSLEKVIIQHLNKPQLIPSGKELEEIKKKIPVEEEQFESYRLDTIGCNPVINEGPNDKK